MIEVDHEPGSFVEFGIQLAGRPSCASGKHPHWRVVDWILPEVHQFYRTKTQADSDPDVWLDGATCEDDRRSRSHRFPRRQVLPHFDGGGSIQDHSQGAVAVVAEKQHDTTREVRIVEERSRDQE